MMFALLISDTFSC